MSQLEEQMRELKIRQHKVQYLKDLLALLKLPEAKENPSAEGQQAETEIVADIKTFVEAKIDEIENGTLPPQHEATSGPFSEEEVQFFKDFVARAKERGVTSQADEDYAEPASAPGPMERSQRGSPPSPRRSGPQQPQRRGQPDLIQFAQSQRHMNGKRIVAQTKQGRVGGTVVGVSSVGFLQVQTDTGHQIPISIDSISLE